jgi:thiol:disulfide interchange protein
VRRIGAQLAAILGLGVAAVVLAGAAGSKHVQASLVAEVESIRPGEPFWVGLRLQMADGWHTYWKNPGDSGLPTRIAWTMPEGFEAGPIVWPRPERIEAGPLVSHGYEGEVLLPIVIVPSPKVAPPGPVKLLARVNWLECKEACLPGKADLELVLPVAVQAPKPVPEWAGLFAKTRSLLPAEPDGWRFSAHPAEGTLSLAARPPASWATPRKAHFFSEEPEVVEYAAPQILNRTADGFRLDLVPASNPRPVTALTGVLVLEGPAGIQALHVEAPQASTPAPAAVAPAGTGPGLLVALGLAFVGGLILNLMPCVLPVLSLKVLSFVRHGGGERGAWRHGAAFTAGALVFFWLLAGMLLVLRAGGAQVGWGFQLQHPPFVVFLSGLFLLLALNLFGVFEVGHSMAAAGGLVAGRSGLLSSFGSGALATLVATPCSAPFMGSALGFALGQPAAVTLLIFTSLGLGMAAPYLLLSIFPALLRFVPRPGVWMVTFKQLMGFLLLGTVAVLVWVFGRQVGVDGMALLLGALILMGLGAWVYGRGGSPDRSRRSRLLATATGVALVAAGLVLGFSRAQALPPAQSETGSEPGEGLRWERFSAGRLEELRASGTPVFIDFTADWCLTCQVNDRVALHRPEVVERFQREGIVALRADWTRKDDDITQALLGYGRQGVPVYVLYGREPGAAPQLLPEVLSPGIVLSAIERTVSSTTKEAKSE